MLVSRVHACMPDIILYNGFISAVIISVYGLKYYRAA